MKKAQILALITLSPTDRMTALCHAALGWDLAASAVDLPDTVLDATDRKAAARAELAPLFGLIGLGRAVARQTSRKARARAACEGS